MIPSHMSSNFASLWQKRETNHMYTAHHTSFLPRDASTERGNATVSRLSVCP